MPFNRIPKIMTIHLVLDVITMLTYFPTKGGISKTWSPQMLVKGRRLDEKKDLRLPTGAYCQVHEEELPRNSQKARTLGAICLGPTGNDQGGYKFMSLKTEEKITRYSWDELPMPDSVIARVNKLAKDQPEDLIFTNKKGELIGDVEVTGVDGELEQVTPQIETIEEDNDLELQAEQEALDQIMDEEPAAAPNEPKVVVDDEPRAEAQPEELVVLSPQDSLQTVPESEVAPQVETVVQPVETTAAEPAQSTGVRRSTRVKFQAKEPYVPSMTGSRYATAVTQLQSHGALHPDMHMQFFQHMCDDEPDVVAAIMTQLSLKRGLREWGGKAEEAVYQEMKQLHLRDTFSPKHWQSVLPGNITTTSLPNKKDHS